MSILFFTKGDKAVASSRQRVWLLAERLGYPYEIIWGLKYPFWSLSKKRFEEVRRVLRMIKCHDVLFVHKSLFPIDIIILILLAKKIFKRKIIFDLDDAEWEHSPTKSKILATGADVVFAGSHLIYDWGKRYNAAVELVPTCFDHTVYKKYSIIPEKRGIYTLVWVGLGTSHFRFGNLDILQPIFAALKERGFRFQFLLIGSQNNRDLKRFFTSKNYESIFIDDLDWGEEGIVAKMLNIYNADIGLAPSKDSSFEQGKCAGKILEYMACGIPVVASPMGENNIVVRDGVNGFLADSVVRWVEKILSLAENVELRRRLGREGQSSVADFYSYQVIVPKVKKILENL